MIKNVKIVYPFACILKALVGGGGDHGVCGACIRIGVRRLALGHSLTAPRHRLTAPPQHLTDPPGIVASRHSPLIEIGAGAGQWQRALAQVGADILAFDTMAELPLPFRKIKELGPEYDARRGTVYQGNENVR